MLGGKLLIQLLVEPDGIFCDTENQRPAHCPQGGSIGEMSRHNEGRSGDRALRESPPAWSSQRERTPPKARRWDGQGLPEVAQE